MSVSRASTSASTRPSTQNSESAGTNNTILIQKLSHAYHNLKESQEKIQQQNGDLQSELEKIRQRDHADRLVIEETVNSATSDEIADNYCKHF